MPDPRDNVAPVDEGAEVGPVPRRDDEEDRDDPAGRSEGPLPTDPDRPPPR